MPIEDFYNPFGSHLNYVSDFINNEFIIKTGLIGLVNQINNSCIQFENSFRKISTNDPMVIGITALVIGGSCLFLGGKVVYDVFSKKDKQK
jgi:hypothetical protein